ncbi:hypothetical protein U1Q18_042187 [Sarracenia purpurea var. burkii]
MHTISSQGTFTIRNQKRHALQHGGRVPDDDECTTKDTQKASLRKRNVRFSHLVFAKWFARWGIRTGRGCFISKGWWSCCSVVLRGLRDLAVKEGKISRN